MQFLILINVTLIDLILINLFLKDNPEGSICAHVKQQPEYGCDFIFDGIAFKLSWKTTTLLGFSKKQTH